MERYASLITPEDFTAFSEHRHPRRSAVHRAELEPFLQFTDDHYASEGFPYHDPRTLERLYYYPALRAIDGSRHEVPAELVFLRGIDSHRWCAMSSSGLGTGRSWGAAAAAAYYELIERAAFLRTWYAKRSEVRLLLSDQDPDQLVPGPL